VAEVVGDTMLEIALVLVAGNIVWKVMVPSVVGVVNRVSKSTCTPWQRLKVSLIAEIAQGNSATILTLAESESITSFVTPAIVVDSLAGPSSQNTNVLVTYKTS